MKTIKYVIVGVVVLSLSLSNISKLWGQEGSIEFMETYSCFEVTSNLDPEDKFFQLIDINHVDPESSFLGKCSHEQTSELWGYIHSDVFLSKLPDDIRFAWRAQHDDQLQSLFALKQKGKSDPVLDQADIHKVSVQKDKLNDSYSLQITFTEDGAKEWETLTGKNVGRDIAIVVDGKVYSAPWLIEQIKHGDCSISGNFNENEISRFKALLEPSHR